MWPLERGHGDARMPILKRWYLAALLVCACSPRSVGEAYADAVTQAAAAATKEYLARVAAAADPRATAGSQRPIKVAAATTFTRPRIFRLEPCFAMLVFSYQYEGKPVDGASELRCDPETGAWIVESVGMSFET